MTMPDETPVVFQALADYQVPATPTIDAFQDLWTRTRTLFRSRRNGPIIPGDRLQRSTSDMLEEIASPPACGPLVGELQATLADWLAEPQPLIRNRLIVMPPGDRDGVLRSWAESHQHTLLEAPAREDLLDNPDQAIGSLDGEGVLVIPALEQWFMRHRSGLGVARSLLMRLDDLDRHVVVGCNSWAWQFLVRVLQADNVLGPPLTFQAFDARRLRDWFSEIAVSERLGPVEFVDTTTGQEVLAAEDNDDEHDLLVTLAARSRGVPWIAWQLWRRSLRDRAMADNEDDTELSAAAQGATRNDRLTLWVTAPEVLTLPDADQTDTLLILQALLIHGALPPVQLSQVLPMVGDSNRLSALLTAGIVERDGAQLYCAPAAYSTIRNGLATAGFPIASL